MSRAAPDLGREVHHALHGPARELARFAFHRRRFEIALGPATHRSEMIDQSFDILVSEVGVPHIEHLTMFMHSDRIGVL